MAFLFQDQNQGTRNSDSHAKPRELPQPFSFIRTLTVGFGITPNLLTLPRERKALAGLGYVTLTAGGDFHPALRTSAARNGRPEAEYDQRQGRQQAPSAPESACPHVDGTEQRAMPDRRDGQSSTDRHAGRMFPWSESDSKKRDASRIARGVAAPR